jgi:PAS domain S-box-containing protein
MTNESAIEASPKSKSAKLYLGSFTDWTALVFTISIVIFLVWYIFKPEENPNLNLICDLAQMISSTAAFITAWHVSKNKVFDDQTKNAWNILTLAFFSYACGQTLWFYFSSVLGVEPFPSVADIGYTAFYPLMLWALRSFPTAPQTSTDKKKFWLDASTVMVSGLAVVWHFVIRPTIATGDEPLKIGLNLLYVVGDMVLFLGIVTILLKQPKQISRRALYSIIAGLISVSVADIGFAYATLQNISPTGTWFDSLFTVNSYFMIMAGFFQHQSARKYADKETAGLYQSAKINWLPYIAVFIGYIMLLIVSQPYWTEPLGAFIFAAFIITGLVVLRQIVSVRENLRLVSEHSAQKNELKMRSLLENSTDITSIMNESGHFEYLSPAMEKIFGWNNEELLGTHMYRLVHPDDVPHMLKAYTDNIGQFGKNIALEYRFKHADGTWHDLDGIGQIFLDVETNSNRVLINARDVTARKADELRLREYTKKLQSSNRELQDFAFVASHDLQEPLRKVQAFGDRLSDKFGDKLGETGLDYLNRMQSASRRMQILITDLLTFSRVTTQAKPFIAADLNKIVGEVLSDLEVKIEDTKAKVTIENLPKFEMDTTQMRQLFQNLVGNGLKFSKPDTSPVINIRSETNHPDDQSFDHIIFDDFTIIDSEIPKGYCRIYVEDNGIGFDEKYLDRIFTVFQRLHGRTAYEGSGVGLAVCRKIVERHNGHLTAKSQPNNGATFIITLPLTQTENGEINELKTNDTISR